MKVDTSYKYYVIQFLQSPFQNIDDFVCVPTTWIEDRGSKGIYAAYPSERLPTTRTIVKYRQDYDKEWKFYLCIPKYGTNCPWDAENIIRVESSKKLNALLDTSQVLPSKQSGAHETKSKTKPKMNTRDELTQSLKRKVSIDCSRNRKAARNESTPDVLEPTSNVSNSEKKSAICSKDLAVMISRLPEVLITKSKVVDLTDNEEETPSNNSYVEKMHSNHSETGTSSANNRRKSAPGKVDETASSSSSYLMQILQETPDSVNNRRNSTSSRPSSQSGQLTMNTTKNLSTTNSIKKLTNRVTAESNTNASKIDVNPPLQNNNYNPPAKDKSSVDTLDNIHPSFRLLQEFIASGGLKDVDHAILQNCLKYAQEIAQDAHVASLDKQAVQVTPPIMQSAEVAPHAMQAAEVAPQAMQVAQAAQAAPHAMQAVQRTPPIMQSAQVAAQAMQAAQAAPHAMQAAQRTPPIMQSAQVAATAMQAAQVTPPATKTGQVTLQAMQATQVTPKQAQTINNSPGVPYPITANAPILYQDPHERQITTERSTVPKIIDPTYLQSRAHNVSNIQNISHLQYLPYNNQVFEKSQHRQNEQQRAANGSLSIPVSGRVPDRSYTTCCPPRPNNSVPSNVQMRNLQQQHYAVHKVPLGPNIPKTSKTSRSKNQMPSNKQMPSLPQQNFTVHPVPIAHKIDQTPKLIHTMSNISASNHPHSYEYSHHDRYNYSHQGCNYSHSDVQIQQNVLQRFGTGHKHPGIVVPTQSHLHTYPPNATTQLRQLHSAHVNNTIMSQAYTNYPHQVPQVQENITARPRSNDMIHHIPQSHDMPHNIPTAVQQISNPPSNSNDKTNSANILNNSNQIATKENMREKTDETGIVTQRQENPGENALYTVENPNTNTNKSPCDSVQKVPVCNEINGDNAVPTEIPLERSSSADTVKIDQSHYEAEDILTELTNKINDVLSPTFRAQIEVNLIKHFGKVFQIMSDKFGEILEVLNRDQKMIMQKKEMLDKAITSIACYLKLQDENSATVLTPKHSSSVSQKVLKKKKNKKRRKKDVDDDEDDEDYNYSLDDGDRHNNNDSHSSDDNGNNKKSDINSNSSSNNKLNGKKSAPPNNDDKHSEGKTNKTKDDKKTVDSDGDKTSKFDSNNPNEETKRRGKKYSFVLPREYSPTNPRWTLMHQSATQGTIELLPKSRIYVNAIKLANIKRISNSYKEFARTLLTLIFTRSALSVCSWTGARANAFAVNESDVRPGLDENARQVMLNYVERVGRKKKWGKYDEQSVVNSLRATIQHVRKQFNQKLRIKSQ